MGLKKRWRVFGRAWTAASLRLEIWFLRLRVQFRIRSAERLISRGEGMVAMGEAVGDRDLVADGHATIDRGVMIQNEIETGIRQAPRPASYWANNS